MDDQTMIHFHFLLSWFFCIIHFLSSHDLVSNSFVWFTFTFYLPVICSQNFLYYSLSLFIILWFGLKHFCMIHFHFLSSHDLLPELLHYSLSLFIILWFILKHFCMIDFHFLSSHDLLPDFLYSRGWEKFDGGQTRAFGFESTRPTKPKLTILHPPVSPPHHPNNTKITPILHQYHAYPSSAPRRHDSCCGKVITNRIANSFEFETVPNCTKPDPTTAY